MKPPYDITPKIVSYIASIHEKIGAITATHISVSSPKLRKQNKIKTIQSSLEIEGNTLSIEQITALVDKKRIVGPQKDITEVKNAIKVYEKLQAFQPTSETSFLDAHKILMTDLEKDAGVYRRKSVGIVKGNQVEHLAPPHKNVPYLMKDLFRYLNETDEISLIKSCVFHYEMEFIHPFMDGNGRMGRLWQTLLLMEIYPVFEFIPFETLISQEQSNYYKALSLSDKAGNSTPFIEFMLEIIDNSLMKILSQKTKPLQSEDRVAYFISIQKKKFSRKEYLDFYKDISSATASRDLKLGVLKGLLTKEGEKNKTTYKVKNEN